MTCAVAVAFFLPYCQVTRSNIIVDFFTVRASERTRQVLDGIGALALAGVMALIAWRTLVGTIAIKSSNETSMIMGLPIWHAYALATPALALTAIAGLHTAYVSWMGR
jgi:TRAP-type C4-dicarboxylate transport system permease small subunit